MYKKFIKIEPWQQILVSIVLGILCGLYYGKSIVGLSFLGTIFINLIKMITVPLVFFSIIYGITSIQNTNSLYRISIKAIFAFIITAAIAVVIGFISAWILKPGEKVIISQLTSSSTYSLPQAKPILDVLISIVPTNIVSSLAEGNILQIIIFSFFIGIIMQTRKQNCNELIAICHQVSQLLFKMIEVIMKIAPIGVFGYVSATVGMEGIDVIFSMGKLVGTIFFGCSIQYIMFGIFILLYGKISPIPFFRKMVEPQLLAFATSSSKATLTTLIRVSEEKLGISKANSNFLLPLSAALNMDGGAIYQSVCAIFFSQAFGLELSVYDYLTLSVMCTIASIGGAGIPSGVLLFLGMVLQSIGLPVECVLMVTIVDRILDMITTVINITGDACVTLLIDKSEGTLNEKIYNKNI